MAIKAKSPPKNPGDSDLDGPPSSPREMIVKARPGIGFRATREAGPSAEAADAAPLSQLLEAEGATMAPLFGLSEARMRDRTASLAAAGAEVLDMDVFYHVDAPEERLDRKSVV